MVVPSRHRVNVPNDIPSSTWYVNDETRIGRLGQIRGVLSPREEDRERGPTGIRDEPLVPVDHPLVAVLHGGRADECRVAAGDFTG